MHPAKTMLIKEGTFAIHGNMADMFAIQKDGIIVAFDAGDNLDKIKQSFNSLSLDPANVKAVFLTHSDADHLAGLPLFHNAVVHISRDEVPVAEGKIARHFMGIAHSNKFNCAKARKLVDGDTVMVGNMVIRAIATPGHTAGSMSYVIDSGLFCGDLCVLKEGGIEPMIDIFTEDKSTDEKSIGKITSMPDIAAIYTAHSGWTFDISKASARWRKQ
jgi:hydroxyacylglutathione hydrolase